MARLDPPARKKSGPWPAEDKAGGSFGKARRSLDARAALAGQPEARFTRKVVARSRRSTASATSRSSGCASVGSDGVSSEGETRNLPASGFT
jgi:hypothetical protein